MDARKPKVGLLGLTLEFYESLAPDIRPGRDAWVRSKVLPALAPQAEVIYHGAVFNRTAIEKEVAALEAAGAEALLVILLTYSTSLSSLQALKRTALPVLVWNTQELFAVDESFSSADRIANHGVHGTFDLCNVLTRSRVPFVYITSHLDDPGAAKELGAMLRAAAAVTQLRNMRLGLLGYPFPGMGDFGLDTTHMAATLGCATEAMALSEYVDRVARCDAAATKKLTAEYRRAYDVAPEVTEEDLAAAARAELALRSMIQERRLDAYSYQFLAFGQDSRCETLPFIAACRLMAEGVGFGGEGDLIAAAFSTVLNRMAPPATFSEVFTIDFAGDSLLLSHMGEANPAMARKDRRIRLVRHAAPIVPGTHNQLGLAVCYEPGHATLAALTLVDGQRWRIIASPMAMLDFYLPTSETPHAKLASSCDIRSWLTAYASAGGPHHLAVCYGNACGQLRLLAKLIGADYVEV